MRCAFCNGPTKVIDSRQRSGEDGYFRRRECLVCDKRFNTTESYVEKVTQKEKEFDNLVRKLAIHLAKEAAPKRKKRPGRPVKTPIVKLPPSNELAKLIEEQAKDDKTNQIQYGSSLDRPDIYGRSQYDIREGYS